MKTIVAIILVLVTAQALPAQLRHKTYRVRLELMNGHMLTGYLQHVTDSSIQVTKNLRRRGADTTFCVSRIKTIWLRNQKTSDDGFLMGGILGGIVGWVIGYESGANCVVTYIFSVPDGGSEISAVAGAFIGFLFGGTLGWLTRVAYTKFEINGNTAAFKGFRESKVFNAPVMPKRINSLPRIPQAWPYKEQHHR